MQREYVITLKFCSEEQLIEFNKNITEIVKKKAEEEEEKKEKEKEKEQEIKKDNRGSKTRELHKNIKQYIEKHPEAKYREVLKDYKNIMKLL